MNNLPSATIDNLYKKIEALVTKARTSVLSSVNIAEVCTKFMVGKYIVEEEQHGKNRAQYGQKILKTLSERLTNRFGEGWSYSNLRQVRKFYLIYEKMTDSVCQIGNDKQSLSNFGFTLSWSHYLILKCKCMSIIMIDTLNKSLKNRRLVFCFAKRRRTLWLS